MKAMNIKKMKEIRKALNEELKTKQEYVEGLGVLIDRLAVEFKDSGDTDKIRQIMAGETVKRYAEDVAQNLKQALYYIGEAIASAEKADI